MRLRDRLFPSTFRIADATSHLRSLLKVMTVVFVLAGIFHHARYLVATIAPVNESFDHHVNLTFVRALFQPDLAFTADFSRYHTYDHRIDLGSFDSSRYWPWITTGLPILFPVGLVDYICRGAPEASRLAMVAINLCGLLACLLLMLLFYRDGWIAMALFSGWLIASAIRMGADGFFWNNMFGDLPAFFLFFLSVLLAPRAKERLIASFLCGLLLALSFETKLILLALAPPLVAYLAWQFSRWSGKAAHPRALPAFVAGVVLVVVVIGVGHLVIEGSVVGFIRYLSGWFSWVRGSSGLGNVRSGSVWLDRFDRRWRRFLPYFGGAIPSLIGLAIAVLSFRFAFLKNPESSLELPSALILLLAGVVPIVHWLLIDPFGWSRRMLPDLLAIYAGACLLVAASRQPLIQASFAGYVLFVCMRL